MNFELALNQIQSFKKII